MRAEGRPTIRVVVTGEGQSGKTSLIRRYVNNYFPKKPQSSHGLGLDHAVKLINIRDTGAVVLQISEDEITSEIGPTPNLGYHRAKACQRAHGAIMIFDPFSDFNGALQRVAIRKAQFDAEFSHRNGDNLPVVLVANKSDIISSEKNNNHDNKLDNAAMDLFTINNNFLAWFNVSAKTGDNVDQAFAALAHHIMAVQENWDVNDDKSVEDMFFEHCACA